MTTTLTTLAQSEASHHTARYRGGTLTGTRTLVELILRRDRIRLPIWLLGMSALLVMFLNAVTELTSTEEQRQDLHRIMGGTVGAVFGPGYGRDAITAERYVVGVYGVFFFVLAALMSLLLVIRHTRSEEQHGRAELVRASAVGRYAPLTAVLMVAGGANTLLAILLGGTMIAHGHDRSDALLFGASVAAIGLVFAGFATLTVQLTEYSGTATGMICGILGIAWAVRAAGDMLRDYGSPLSWLSPLAWSNQTRPFVDGRWWPLLLSGVLAVTVAAGGYALSAHRDVGAGLIAARAGTPSAAAWLASPIAVAFRLRRSSIAWWTVTLAVFGFLFGALGEQITDPAQMSEDRIEVFGGSVDTLLDGYLGVITLFTAALAGIMVVLGMQALRHEETSSRADPVLATATSRWAWLGGFLTVIALGVTGLLLVAGLATGTGVAIATGDGSYLWRMATAHLAHVPGVLVILGIATLLYGLAPRMIGLTWVVVGFSLFSGLFGPVTDLPSWLLDLSPMEHVGRPPLDAISWSSMVVLLVIAAGLGSAGLIGFRRRDIELS